MEKQTFTLALDMLNKETGKFEVGGLPGIDDHIMWDIEFEVPEKYGIYHIIYEIQKWIKEYFYGLANYSKVDNKENIKIFFEESDRVNKIIHQKDQVLSRHFYNYFGIIEKDNIMYGIFVMDKNGAILSPYVFEEDGTYIGREIESIKGEV